MRSWLQTEKEIANCRANEVVEEVENTEQRVMSVRWGITEKSKGCENIISARLVSRGLKIHLLSKLNPQLALRSQSGWLFHWHLLNGGRAIL